MKSCLSILGVIVVLLPLARADIIEEETWYNAEGKVVKKVKRTLTGAEAAARSEPDWEPAWVIRERERDARARVPYRQARRYHRTRGGGYGWGYGYGYYYPRISRYYYPRSYVRGGFTGYIRTGGGKTRWGVGYRSRGVNVLLTR
ncbi:MAG: hypothetical protein GWO24_31810 [Akkermansiaceae bacterium]|nr:hypothetical protein [Akkermansiaceae bacterium]